MSYETWQEALAALVKRQDLQETELGRLSAQASGTGSPDTSGTVGAPGHLTHVLETLDQALRGVSFTREGGSRIFQGRLLDISSLSRGGEGGVYTLMVSFDYLTRRRLEGIPSGDPGIFDTAVAECSATIVTGVRPTT